MTTKMFSMTCSSWAMLASLLTYHQLASLHAHSAPLYMRFLVKSWIIGASAATATHTHHLLKWPSTCTQYKVCTWDVVQSVFFPLSEMRTYQLGCFNTAHRMCPQRFWMATELPYNTNHRLSKRSAWAQLWLDRAKHFNKLDLQWHRVSHWLN